MQYSEWHKYDYSEGRQFFNHKDVYQKYDEKEKIMDRICEILNEVIRIESAVRITTDVEVADSERLIMAVPLIAEEQKLIRNFSEMLYYSVLAYYFHANPKTYHFGISNIVLEGHLNTFILREIEAMFSQVKNREDIAGRVVKHTQIEQHKVERPGDNYLRDTIMRGLDITLGYRMVLFGDKINSNSLFIPVPDGADVIEQIYYNLEHILNTNFSTYDELNERDYLVVTDTLVFKELVATLKRARLKENTRKKLLNNIKFPTYFTKDPSQLFGAHIGDLVYDTINHVDDPVIREASERSRELFNLAMIHSTEITQKSGVDVNNTPMETSGSTYVPSSGGTTKPSAPASRTTKPAQKVPSTSTSVKKSSSDDLIEL